MAHIEMLDNLPDAPTKVPHRNQTTKIMNDFMSSDKPHMAITCDTVRDAMNMNVGIIAYNKRRGYVDLITVWRDANVVYVSKESTNGN